MHTPPSWFGLAFITRKQCNAVTNAVVGRVGEACIPPSSPFIDVFALTFNAVVGHASGGNSLLHAQLKVNGDIRGWVVSRIEEEMVATAGNTRNGASGQEQEQEQEQNGAFPSGCGRTFKSHQARGGHANLCKAGTGHFCRSCITI
jgi:hypothetical protein